MQLVDTHCHLYVDVFSGDLDAVFERAAQAGVARFYLPAISSAEMPALLGVAEKYSDRCFAMAGLHPTSVKNDVQTELEFVQSSLLACKFAAIGEIGLDYYWDKTYQSQQIEAFQLQMEWALSYDLPIVIHSRESMEDCIEMVKRNQNGRLKGIFHCFTGNYESAVRIIDLGFYLGIGGVLTYKNAGLDQVVAKLSMEHMVLETDAPYLAPVPYRGKRNESSYLLHIANRLAAIKGVSVETVAEITTANAEKVFGG